MDRASPRFLVPAVRSPSPAIYGIRRSSPQEEGPDTFPPHGGGDRRNAGSGPLSGCLLTSHHRPFPLSTFSASERAPSMPGGEQEPHPKFGQNSQVARLLLPRKLTGSFCHLFSRASSFKKLHPKFGQNSQVVGLHASFPPIKLTAASFFPPKS